MPNKLTDLTLTSVDLVQQGANPDSYVRMFKRMDAADGAGAADKPDTVFQKALSAIAGAINAAVQMITKNAETFSDVLEDKVDDRALREVTEQVWDWMYSMSDSLASIICDGGMTADAKNAMMLTSLEEFISSARAAIPVWAGGKCAGNGGDKVVKSAESRAAFDGLMARYIKSGCAGGADEGAGGEAGIEKGGIVSSTNINKSNQREETDTMKLDKSRMTGEERDALEVLEKKYGADDPADLPEGGAAADGTPAESGAGAAGGGGEVAKGAAGSAENAELHPDVKKALDDNRAMAAEVAQLKKSLEIEKLTAFASKYEAVGKRAGELAPKLYDLKEAGGTAYDDYVALLDEQVTLVEKSGLFSEMGSGMSGGTFGAESEIEAKVGEIMKGDGSLTKAQAVVKAFDLNPQLAARYQNEYTGGTGK
ncbi:MAG: hypothetical protein FWE80_01870 [Oscillospiraceae bacterium]|nr:hypothetical protein [Oscillospiraceae bacterium]